MEPTHNLPISVLFLIIVAVIGIIIFLFYEWGRIGQKRYDMYDKKYCSIVLLIRFRSVCIVNELYILDQFTLLKNMKYKDDERTDVLEREFSNKFDLINEFEPSEIFVGE